MHSAHDVSEGGLAIALAECALRSGIGLEVELAGGDLRTDSRLFGETPSRAVLSVAPGCQDAVLEICARHGVPAAVVGQTGGDRIRIRPGVDLAVAEAQDVWSRTLPEVLG